MFSYYGSKSKVIKHYPLPQRKLIIEPFAGSARYALLHSDNHDVWINDLSPDIFRIWRWFQQCSESDILSLPDLKQGDDIRLLPLSPEERLALGFVVNQGVASSKHHTVTKWAAKGEVSRFKQRWISHLPKIRDWNITNLSYDQLPDEDATWFVDPPYVKGGERYPCHYIDFPELGKWCRSRRGQVIVCESLGADWLPFVPLREVRGQRKRISEVVFLQNTILS